MEWRCVKLAKSKRWWYFSTLNMYINRLCFNQRSLHWVWRRHGSICSKQFWLSKQLFVELASCLPLMVSPQNDTMVWSQLCHGSTSIKKQPESKQSALTWAISPCQTTGKINLELTVKVVLTYADEKPARTNKLKTTNDQRDSDHRNSKKKTKKNDIPIVFRQRPWNTCRNLAKYAMCFQYHLDSISEPPLHCFPWKSCQILDFKEHKRANVRAVSSKDNKYSTGNDRCHIQGIASKTDDGNVW